MVPVYTEGWGRSCGVFYLQQDLLPQQPGEQGPCPLWDTPFPAGVVRNDSAGAA